VYVYNSRGRGVDNELELEGLMFEESSGSFIFPEEEAPEDQESLSDRWASWINIVNR